MLGRGLGTFHASGRENALNGRFSFISSGGHGIVVGTLGGTRGSSRCMIHICRVNNRGIRSTMLSFTNRVTDTYRTSNARGDVNSTRFDKGKLSMDVGPCSVGAFGMHLGSSNRSTCRLRCTSLPLSCGYGYSSFGRFHNRTSFRSNCSFTTRLLPRSLAMGKVPFRLNRGSTTGKVAYGNSAVILPRNGGCGGLCFLTTTASKSCTTAFQYKKGGDRIVMPSCAKFIKR